MCKDTSLCSTSLEAWMCMHISRGMNLYCECMCVHVYVCTMCTLMCIYVYHGFM